MRRQASPRRSPSTRRTSADALESMREHLARCQRKVLHVIRDCGPVTDEQIAREAQLSPSCARPRRVELVAKGLVVDSGLKGRTASGRRAIAWRVAL